MVAESEGMDNYLGMLTKNGAVQLLKALGISVLVLAVSVSGGMSLLAAKPAQMVTMILSITTLGLLFSTTSLHF